MHQIIRLTNLLTVLKAYQSWELLSGRIGCVNTSSRGDWQFSDRVDGQFAKYSLEAPSF